MSKKDVAAVVAAVQRECKASHLGARDAARSKTAAAALSLKGADRLAVAMAFFDAYALYAESLQAKEAEWNGGQWMNLHERHLWLTMGPRLLQKQEKLGAAEWERVFGALAKFGGLSTFDHAALPTLIAVAEASLPSIRPVSKTLRADVATVAGTIRNNGRAAEQRLAKRLEDLVRIDDASGGDPGGGSSALEKALLSRETLKVEMTGLLWQRLLEGFALPAEGDNDAPSRFDGAAVPEKALKEALQWLNGLFGQAPTTGRDEPYATKVMEEASKRSARELPLSFVMSALTVVSQRQVRYADQSKRYVRHSAAVGAMLGVLSDMLATGSLKKEEDLVEFAMAFSSLRPFEYYIFPTRQAVVCVTQAAAGMLDGSPASRLACALLRFRERVARTPHAAADLDAFDRALGIGTGFPVDLGERWSDAIRRDLLAMKSGARAAWMKFLEHCAAATGSKPSAKWLATAREHVAAIGAKEVEARFAVWLPLVGKPRPLLPGGTISGRDSSVPGERGADTLRGMAWAASHVDTARMASTLGDLAMACYKMVPGVGARCIKPGTSAVWTLSGMSTPAALGQLSRVRQLVKFGTAQKTLDAALEGLAAKLGMTTAELHEIAAPDFGLERDGTLREEAGEFVLELRVSADGAEIVPLDESGKARKSMPDAVRKEHGETLKAIKQAQGDINKMLDAQRARVDALFVEDRVWKIDDWRQRYVDHPLVGVIARRLIWSLVDSPKTSDRGRSVVWDEAGRRLAGLDGGTVKPAADQHVRLWHPIFAKRDEVLAWRQLLEAKGVRQPVKQAHREVYPLTDAELRTATYSNRYAAHFLKQHAFQKLAQERGWKSRLRLMVDDEYPPPSRELPGWGLRAEFWTESIAQEYGRDTTETGSLLYIATDQVRFYSTGAAQARAHAGGGRYTTRGADVADNQPLPLEHVPPLVFSEIMRDVDLFVAGASVGNNADWADGGPEGGFVDYWQSYAFGALGPSAVSRQELLQSLVPRLAIAAVCSFEGRFLVVRGKLRTYKIHLGSGNILMTPNDQYLCIVPSSADEVRAGRVYLPFEGDRTMAIILSKAVMLADDDKIKDASITSQIMRK